MTNQDNYTINKPKKKRKIWIWLIVVVIILGSYFAFSSKNPKGADISNYDSYTVETGDISLLVKGTGAVASLDTLTHYAKVAGQVEEVLIENGDIVQKGDVIMVLDSSTVDEHIESIQTQIDNALSTIYSIYPTYGISSISSPTKGIIKAIYAKVDEDINSTMDKYNSLMLLSIDGRMKAEVTGLDVSTISQGEEVEFIIGDKSVQGVCYLIDATIVTFTVKDDDYDIDTPVTINNIDGAKIADSTLQVNMPLNIVDHEGTVSKIKFSVGDVVYKGTKVIYRDGEIPSYSMTTQVKTLEELYKDLKDAEDDLDAIIVKAQIDGIVTDLVVSKNVLVTEGQSLYTIQTTKELKIEIEVDELDISKIKVGYEAIVELDALPNKRFDAIITKINPIGVSVNNVTNFTATLLLEGDDDILIGMSASVDIPSYSKENVVLIPIEAVQLIDGNRYVLMADEIGITDEATHQIEVGISDGVMVEVTQGLSAGDAIAVPGKEDAYMGMGPMR